MTNDSVILNGFHLLYFCRVTHSRSSNLCPRMPAPLQPCPTSSQKRSLPWAGGIAKSGGFVESYADRLMDELFEDVEQSLEMGSIQPEPAARPAARISRTAGISPRCPGGSRTVGRGRRKHRDSYSGDPAAYRNAPLQPLLRSLPVGVWLPGPGCGRSPVAGAARQATHPDHHCTSTRSPVR